MVTCEKARNSAAGRVTLTTSFLMSATDSGRISRMRRSSTPKRMRRKTGRTLENAVRKTMGSIDVVQKIEGEDLPTLDGNS